MENKKRRFLKNEKGFTLIELIVIIAILAIISVVAIPNVLNVTDDAEIAADVANAKNIAVAAATLIANGDITSTGAIPITVANTDGAGGDDNADAVAIVNYLNGQVPIPQSSNDSFIVNIDATTRNVTVALSPDATYEAADTDIFPNPEGDYAN